ncbi:hypothetical protein MNV49_004666 [Pseudohyphozyma bogoriensis]|nr:hypothetical protein MNV49_004666 [Pseudohyphozyma bogoriensis]
MVSLKRVEDRPTPSAFIGGTIALASFKKAFGINASNSSYLSTNIVTVYQAGAFWGSLFAYPVANRFGRKICIISSGWIFCVGVAVQLAAHSGGTIAALYVGRVLAGIGIGFISLAVPIYISEISPPAIRGRLVALYEVCLQFGAVLGFWINYGVNITIAPNKVQWTIPIAIQLIPGGLLILSTPFLIESPRWLRSKGKNDQAVKDLAWIRNLPADHVYVVEELAMLDAQLAIEEEKNSGTFFDSLKELFGRTLGWRLFIYSPTVFSEIGITGTNQGLFTTGIFGIVKCTASCFWCFFLVDAVGRRRMLLIGSAGAAVTMCILTALLQTNHPAAGVVNGQSKAAAAMLYLWTLFYGPTWNGTPWVITAEIFPMHVRALSISIYAAFGNWLWTFVIARAFPYAVIKMKYYVFLLFGLVSFVGFFFVYFCVPETAGVPIERMDELFGTGKGDVLVRDLEAQKRDVLQVEHAKQEEHSIEA